MVSLIDQCWAHCCLTCIKTLDEHVQGMISKYVDDIKVGGIIDSEDGYQILQQDPDQLGKWAEEWLIEFNVDKCKV